MDLVSADPGLQVEVKSCQISQGPLQSSMCPLDCLPRLRESQQG